MSSHGVILQNQWDTSTAKVYQGVLLGVVLWDWLVCLRSEYRFIWQAKLTVMKFLYVLARYVCLLLTVLVFAIQFLDIPLESCHAFVRANCLSLTIVQVTSVSVLTQRVWAVFTHPRWRLPLLGLLIAMDAAVLLLGVLHAAMAVSASPAPMDPQTWRGFCQIQVLHGWMGMTAAFFALPIAAHTLATIAVVYAVHPMPNTNALKRLLLVDGVLYLLAVNTINIVQLIFFFQTSSESLRMLNSAALLSLTAVFCCRLLLHLREQSEEIHRHPFGQHQEDSELSDLSSAEKSGSSRFGFLRRQSRQTLAAAPTKSIEKKSHCRTFSVPGRKANGAGAAVGGTVTIHSEPEMLEATSISDVGFHPIHFVKVKKQVEQQVTDMSEAEKDYTAYVLNSASRMSVDEKMEKEHDKDAGSDV